MALYAGSTLLLMHADGANGSTVFTDEIGRSVTPYGNATISTAQSKFGGASMYFDGVGDYLSVPSSTDFDFDTGDLTIECFIKPDLASQVGVLVGRQEPGNGMAMQLLQHTATITWTTRSQGGGAVYSFGGGTVSTSEWNHVAVTRQGGIARLWLNGNLVNTASDPTNLSCIGRPLSIAILDDTSLGAPYKGFIDDLRVVKGLALYTANFTPPAVPLGLVSPVQVTVTPHSIGSFAPANINPVQGKPKESLLATNLTDCAPYGLPNSLTTGYASLFEFKGRGVITGTVAEKALPVNTPLRRLVMLHRLPEGVFVKAVWSDAVTGNYTFNGVRADHKYFVTSFDYTGTYRAVIADNLVPTPL